MSLDAGKAQPPFGRSRAGKPAMAVSVAAAAAPALPLPPSIITLSDAQIAKIKG